MIVVVDTNVVVSAAFWPKSEDLRVLQPGFSRPIRDSGVFRVLPPALK